MSGALALQACANAGPPPGGPPDTAPPVILSVTPKTMTVGAKNKDVELKFDEVISETPKGAADLKQLVFISPRAIDASVGWHRDRITIHPKGGWKPNTVYSVQVSPGIQDLRNNALDSSVTVVFSTGGAIPNTTISGVAFDWVAGRGARQALVEALAIKGKDTTAYQVLSDSVGRFKLEHAPNGIYLVRAILDRNGNRLLDPTEGFDTLRVTLAERADVEFYAFPHDTVGLRISEVTTNPADSLRILKVSFDKPLLPGQPLNNTQFVVKRADSSTVEVTFVQTAAEKHAADSIKAKNRADSLARVKADTTAAGRARADSVARAHRTDSLQALARAAVEARRLAAARGTRPTAPRDTTPPPKMKKPVVSTDVYLTLATPLEPGKPYRVGALGLRSLSGTVKSPSRQFVTPREVKKDTTQTRRPP